MSDAAVNYVLAYGGRCRDCADNAGDCPVSGLPCDGREKAVRYVVEAIAYGVRNGFIEPFEVGGQPGSPSPNPPRADYFASPIPASNFTLHRQPKIVTGGFVGVPRAGEKVCGHCMGTGHDPQFPNDRFGGCDVCDGSGVRPLPPPPERKA